MLASGATCGDVQLWEAETGKERRRFVGHRGIVTALASTSERILALRTGELLERIGTAEARAGLQTIVKEAPGTLIRPSAEAALHRLRGTHRD